MGTAGLLLPVLRIILGIGILAYINPIWNTSANAWLLLPVWPLMAILYILNDALSLRRN